MDAKDDGNAKLYQHFWGLQSFFAKPTQLFEEQNLDKLQKACLCMYCQGELD